jgi:ABC-type phosphate transport system substrate-binding protein
VVHLQTTTALEHWLPEVADCASAIPNLGVASDIVPPEDLSLDSADLLLRLGARHADDPFTVVLGSENLVLVAGDQVPISTLSAESLQSIYAGDWATWAVVPGADAESAASLPLVLLSAPAGSELENLFSESYLDGNPIVSNPQRYATMQGLADKLNANPTALGYALASQVPEDFRTLPVTGLETPSSFYVLAVTTAEPAGGLRQLLLCLQNPE